MSNSEKLCGTCKWWKELSGDHEGRGQCRQKPPGVIKTEGQDDYATVWPITWAMDWCARWVGPK